jgi:hypothetical protein
MTIERITMRRDPIYHSTYTGKPPDEPAVLGVALNEVFVPLLQKQFPEIADFYLPPEGCSYRLAVVSLRKQYPGHAKRVMFGVWSFLRQFMYCKTIIVTDDDIDVRDWKEVIWALSTRVDAARDTLIVEHTPIDYLDFASPVAGPRQQDGHRRHEQMAGETARAWGRPIAMDPAVKARVDALWGSLGSLARAAPVAHDAQRRHSERRIAKPARQPAGAGKRSQHRQDRRRERPDALRAILDGRRRDDAFHLVDGKHEPVAIELGSRRQQRLLFGAGNAGRVTHYY